MHFERYGNSRPPTLPFCSATLAPFLAAECAAAVPGSGGGGAIFAKQSMLDTTRIVTGAALTPEAASSFLSPSCSFLESTVSARSSEGATHSSLGSVFPRVRRQLPQKKRQSSGVSSPLYMAHVQCSQLWHSSHCTQLSTYSGRSFSFFSRKLSILTLRCAISESTRSAVEVALRSLKHRLHSLTPPSSPDSSQYDQRVWMAWKHFSQNMGGGLKARLSERQTLQTMRQRSCATAFSSTPECIMMS
mmetsp:Transcript_24735/g.73415  ORF Transcript_24735/g.73415 Transcript_24735/m.73415 type:complete len:246 (-) Transcript_24735:349-1086(-)